MIIISWDVGVIHLAYCVIKYKKSKTEILDWDEINLIDDDQINLSCCGHMKTTKKNPNDRVCGKKASYYFQPPGCEHPIGFCKTHLNQHTEYWSINKTKNLFKISSKNNPCQFLKKTGKTCGCKSKYRYTNNENIYLCNVHYKSYLQKKTKEYTPQLIKNLIVKKYPTNKLQINLINKLDKLAKHFGKLGVNQVVIENQPSMKNPKMKSIANTLFDYFLIRGYIDKSNYLDVDLVRFMCPSNKLKVNNNNTLEVFKTNKNSKKKYKLTKELAIQYTKQLLKDEPIQLEILDLHKKKDDMCDAYLQGLYYLLFVLYGS